MLLRKLKKPTMMDQVQVHLDVQTIKEWATVKVVQTTVLAGFNPLQTHIRTVTLTQPAYITRTALQSTIPLPLLHLLNHQLSFQ